MKLLNTPVTLIKTFVCAATLAFATHAGALAIGDAHEFGFINPDHPASPASEVNFINLLITMANGASDSTTYPPNTITRSSHNFSPTPNATLTGTTGGTSTSINLGTTGYSWLAAKYDGPNYGTEVWWIGDLTGIITIPAAGGQYGLSGWNLFNPITTTSTGSGGGSTGGQVGEPNSSALALLGVLLLGATLLRRKATRSV